MIKLLNTCLSISILTLVISCGGGGSSSGSPSPTPNTNRAPVANAGADQNVPTGSTVSLDGSQSHDADNDVLSYQWQLVSTPENSSASLADERSESPTLNVDIEGTYVVELVVSDGVTSSSSNSVTIVAETPNSIPTANAGADQNVVTWATVELNGDLSSDEDGDPLTFNWTLVETPENSDAALSDASTSQSSFTADLDGTYTLELVVNDGTDNSLADTVVITAATENSAPVAHAGEDQEVVGYSTVTLNSDESYDANEDTLSYEWSLTTKPEGSLAELDNATLANPSFLADIEGEYVFTLTVYDGQEYSEPSTVTIEVIEPFVELYMSLSTLLGDNYYEASMPYAAHANVSATIVSVPPITEYSVGKFKLIARGQDFTVINLRSTSSSSSVRTSFSGLTNNQTLKKHEEVKFEAVSSLTDGDLVTLRYDFEIKETGEKFTASYSFRSN